MWRPQQLQRGQGRPHAIPPSRIRAGPIPLSTEADPQGRGQCSGELSGRKGSQGLKCPAAPRPGSALRALCGQQACCSARDLSASSTLCSAAGSSPPPRQRSNGSLALSPSSLLKYLSDHYVFSGQEQGVEGAEGKTEWARCKG